jgi:hypothetical protein
VKLVTNLGKIDTRFYHVPNIKRAVIFVGGVGGGYDSPAKNLYPKLAEQLMLEGISSLRIQYRNPSDLIDSVIDVMAGIMFLEKNGIEEIGLVGHSLGGAVVIQAAANSDSVRTVIALAPQGFGVEPVTDLQEDTSLLLVHGKGDIVLPYALSEYIYTLAHEPKDLKLLSKTGHSLHEKSEEVFKHVHDWLADELKPNDRKI